MKKQGSLLLRLATSAVGIPLLAAAVWAGGGLLLLLTAAVTFLAIWELRRLLQPIGRVLWPISVLIAGALLLSVQTAAISPALLAPIVIGVGILGGVFLMIGLRTRNGHQSLIATAIAAVYPGVLLAAGLALRATDDGLAWLAYAISVTFASDTGAYVVGTVLGRRPLAAIISPGKTWEGAMGGMLGAAIVSAAFSLIVGLDSLPLLRAIVLGGLLSVSGQLGDLTESWLKRIADLKDSGGLLPGHGGILDRLDSLLPILPLVLVYVTVVTTME